MFQYLFRDGHEVSILTTCFIVSEADIGPARWAMRRASAEYLYAYNKSLKVFQLSKQG